MSMSADMVDRLIDRYDELATERGGFSAREGVAAVLIVDDRAREGLLAAEAAGSFKAAGTLAPPTFVVTGEQYGRLARLVAHKQPCASASSSRPPRPTRTWTARISLARSRAERRRKRSS